MLYIATTKTLGNKDILSTIAAEDHLTDQFSVFYKDSDSLKMSDFASIIEMGIHPTACENYTDRDDLLVLLGTVLAGGEEEVTLLDPSIPVPKRFEKRVHVVKARTAAKPRTKKKASVKKEDQGKAEKEIDSNPEKPHAAEKDEFHGVTNPAGDAPSTEKTESKKQSLDKEKPNIAAVEREVPSSVAQTKKEKTTSIKEERQDAERSISFEEKWRKKMEESKSIREGDKKAQEGVSVEEGFTDPQAKALYDLIQLKAEDVGFHWSTQMLMQNILSDIEEAKDDADAELAIMARNNGSKIWTRVKGRVDEIRKILADN